MERYKLTVETREETGKGIARRLRSEGLIPAVIYGKDVDSQALTVELKDLKEKLRGNAIIDLNIDQEGEEIKRTVMIKELQRDPVKRDIIHVDFINISMDEKISISVPLKLTGVPVGVETGGVVQQLMREINLECLPINIPEEIELDITELDVGDSLGVSDIEFGEDVSLLTSPDEIIVTIVTPSEEIEEEEEEEELLEPELIEEGEIDEELEEGEEWKEQEEEREYGE